MLMYRKAKKSKKGITLILAIMIMSAIVAIGITLTSVLVFQVRINKVVKEGHEGYYASESGIELGLNRLNLLKTGLLSTAITSLQNLSLPAGADAEYEKYFCPGGTCANATGTQLGSTLLASSVSANSAASIPAIVKESQSVFIELYNVDDSLNTGATPLDFTSPTLCVFADGLDVGGSDGIGNEVLEVSWVAWGKDLSLSRAQKVFVSYSKFNSAGVCGGITGSKGFSVPIMQFYPAFTPTAFAGFRIRITPMSLTSTLDTTSNGDVTNMAVYTNPANVFSQIQLKSVSDAAGQKQALVALFPWSLPLSSIFDFVIFSDKSIVKSVPISIAQDLKRFGPTTAVEGTNPITPVTAFNGTTPCAGSTPCTYYIRLIATSAAGWQQVPPFPAVSTSVVNTSGTGGAQTLLDLNASSCILRTPYVFTTTNPDIIFTNKPAGLDKYELLTRPAFSTADENYCP